MTALPNPTDFSGPAYRLPITQVLHPNVTEHFWGYEVRPNEKVISSMVILRGICGLLMVALAAASVGIWMLPASMYLPEPFGMKVAATVVLLCLALLCGRIAAQGSDVRMQIDTAGGELREVVDGPFGRVVTLTAFGLDAVKGVEIVQSAVEPSLGQIQLTLKDGSVLPVGDGALTALRPLRTRLANDCGAPVTSTVQPAVWSGPITA